MTRHVVRAARRLFSGFLNSFSSSHQQTFLLLDVLPCSLAPGLEMAPLFAKRLNCFYCGRRSAQTDRDSVRKWRCTHCEAVNYLDEVGRPPLAPVGNSHQLIAP